MKTTATTPEVSTARRWTATIFLSLLLMTMGVLLEAGRPLERMLEERTVPMGHTMASLQNYITAMILQMRDVPFDSEYAKLTVKGAGPNAGPVPTIDPWHGESVTLLLLLLCGVPVVWRTWNLSRWQKLAILGITVIFTPLMLALTAGLTASAALADWNHRGGNVLAAKVMAIESALFATMLIIVGLWILIKKLLADEPPETPAPREPWMVHRPPLLWASLLLCSATTIVCILALPMILAWQGQVAETVRRIASIVGIVAALLVLIQFIRTSRRSLGAWAILSMVLCLSGGLGNYVPGMLMMLIALTFYDERTAALCSEPLDAAAVERLGIRQRKPLLVVSLMLAALAGLAAVYQVRLYFTDTAVTYIPILATAMISMLPAALAALLGWWESRALQREFPVAAYAPFAASAAGALCFVMGLAAWIVSFGHQPLLGAPKDIATPWPQTVKVNDAFHLGSFPTSVGPYVVPTDREGRSGESTLENSALDSFGIRTDFATVRLSERIGNWYLMNAYVDRRPASHLHLLKLGILYYGGLPATSTQRIEPPVGNFPTGVSYMAFTTNDKDPDWRVVPVLRESEGADAEGEVVHVNYYVYNLNGRPRSTAWHVRQLTRNFNRPFEYLAVMHVGLAVKKENMAYADDAAQQFFAAMLPAMLDMMPKAK